MEAESPTPPPEAAVLHAFLNTLDLRTFSRHRKPHEGGDALGTPEELTAWLRAQGLLAGDVRAGREDVARAHALRARLRGALQESPPGHGSPPGQGGPELPLTFLLDAAPGTPPALLPVGSGTDPALGRLVLCSLDAVASGSWARLKVCRAPDCQWVFYDRSRPGRGRWCSPELCGNRMKTRAYRERRATG